MNISSEIIDKLQKLLRLSASPNEHEAALALSRAQEIAIRHQIDLASVSIEERPREAIGRELIEEGGNTRHRKFIHWILGNHFNVKLCLSGKTKNWFIGTPTDIQFAQWIRSYLDAEMPRLWQAYRRRNQLNGGRESTTYYYGFYQGLSEKLKASKLEATTKKLDEVKADRGEENASQVSNSLALATRDKLIQIEKAFKEFFPHTQKSYSRTNLRSQSTLDAGRQAGRNTNLNRPLSSGGSGYRLN